MSRFRLWLLCAALTAVLKLQATPPLATIEDTLFTADGKRFNGVVTISWPSFEAADASNVAAETRQLKITNGILYVQLVPTTNANSPSVYTVRYSSLGSTGFTEAWAVPPPGILPFRVRDVRVAPGSVTGSAPAAATTVQISDVTGLQNALNLRPTIGTGFAVSRAAVVNSTGSLDGAAGNLSDCLHVDGTSGPCGSVTVGSFVDAETPTGTLDGSNTQFLLRNAPSPASGLALFRNGLLLRQNTDYTVSGASVAFAVGAAPQAGDSLLASYRISVTLAGVGFVDGETPSGSIDGSNLQFTLSATPNPAASLALYRNGIRLMSSIDYTISGNALTFASNFTPQTGDVLICSYRIAQ